MSFQEAQTIVFDEHALLIPDPDHSGREERFVLLGLSGALRAPVVCHCYRHGTTIRIISARKANRGEREQDTIAYSKRLSEEMGIPYQTLTTCIFASARPPASAWS